MIRVTIESPYAGDVDANVAYAKRCVLDSLRRGEAPYASHLFFTQSDLLDDTNPDERRLGIQAGLAWQRSSNVVAVYVDRGISDGMRQGIAEAAARGAHIEVRALDREITREDLGAVMTAAGEGRRDEDTRTSSDDSTGLTCIHGVFTRASCAKCGDE